MKYDGNIVNKSYPRVLDAPKGSFFLFGPRGTGKSTWLRAELDDAVFCNLLEEARYHSYLADPGLFARELGAVPAGSTVVVDEIQRLPSLLNEVHRLIEERGLRFALCGSSARKIRRGGVNLLAGRAVQRFMHPFVPEELGADFDLERVLTLGALPVVHGALDPGETLEAYVQMYLREEIQAEAAVRNLPGFARFLPVAALFHGQLVNVSSMARDADVARTTVEGYLEVLEDTLIAFRLPAFSRRLRVRQTRHPKLYFCDPGLPRAIGRRRGDPGPEERGHLFEGWIAVLLRAYRDYRGLFDEWSFWGSTGNTEVDFILERGGELLAIEAKARNRIATADLRGLAALADVGGVVRRVLVCLAERPQRTKDGIDILPVRDFAGLLETGRLWP